MYLIQNLRGNPRIGLYKGISLLLCLVMLFSSFCFGGSAIIAKAEDGNTVTVTVNGKETVYEFDNNLDGLLDKEVSEKSPTAKELLDEHPDAHVSSVKREYDENATLLNTMAYISWTDEDGNNKRKPIIVPND